MKRNDGVSLFGLIIYMFFGVFMILFFLLKLYYKLLWKLLKFIWKKCGGKTKEEIDLCH